MSRTLLCVTTRFDHRLPPIAPSGDRHSRIAGPFREPLRAARETEHRSERPLDRQSWTRPSSRVTTPYRLTMSMGASFVRRTAGEPESVRRYRLPSSRRPVVRCPVRRTHVSPRGCRGDCFCDDGSPRNRGHRTHPSSDTVRIVRSYVCGAPSRSTRMTSTSRSAPASAASRAIRVRWWRSKLVEPCLTSAR